MRRPLVLLVSALSIGCALGASFSIPFIATVLCCSSAFLCAIAAIFLYRRAPNATLILLCMAAFAIGIARAGLAMADAQAISVPLDGRQPIPAEGFVRGEVRGREWGSSFDLALTGVAGGAGGAMQPAFGGVRVNARGEVPAIGAGDLVRLLLKLQTPREFRNPGAFSYRRYLLAHGIAATATLSGTVDRVGERFFAPGARRFAAARERVERSLHAAVPMPAAAVVAALATGSREEFTSDLSDAFALAGLTHLLSVSGLHVAYVALIVALFTRFTLGMIPALLVRVPRSVLAAGLAIPAVWVFVAFTGFQIPAVRSAIMVTVFLSGTVLGLRQDPLTSIAAACALILLLMPLAILDVSFQLSASAVIGISLAAGPLSRWLGAGERQGSPLRRAWGWIAATFAVSAAATAATLPLTAWYFQVVSGVGLVSNTVAVPLTGLLLQPAALLGSILALTAPGLAAPVWHLAGWFAQLLVELARLSSDYGSPLVARWAPSGLQVLCAYALMAWLLLGRRLCRRRALAAAALLLIAAGLAAGPAARAADGRLAVTFLDVGQGDCALVRFPDGMAVLIDGGGMRGSSVDVGRAAVAPALWRLGVRRLAGIVLTHAHYDHYAGLAFIAEHFAPEVIWTNGRDAPPDEREPWEEFRRRATASGARFEAVTTETVAMEAEGVVVRLLPPALPEAKEENGASLVVRVEQGEGGFLLPGDANAPAEAALIARGAPLGAAVLKVGHHGSRDATTPEWLAAVRPRIAVISAGRNNRYGLPSAQVLSRLDAAGIRVLRTDRDGAVTIRSDGRGLEVESVAAGR